MTEPATGLTVQARAITDRGLNERRPLNEDSFLADSQRRIFVVADGVGGAEAGEVASKTAVEVLDEAFRHQVVGADIEDLMELAIQRANASIHQMAREHARFAMMATTVVALHLKGNIATIGHVGDSRLYRLTPDGEIVRETEDHSVVEEEVRAGRMTAAQAANHPSKNVISRALGAEDTVEVDLKTIEVEDGTEFLLCTDGITRHIPDAELRQLLVTQDDLGDLCEELKRRCYERGAEDNLTAVVVRCGARLRVGERSEDMQRTISPETEAVPVARTAQAAYARTADEPPDANHPPSRIAIPASTQQVVVSTSERPLNIPDTSSQSGGLARTVGRFFIFLLFLGCLAVAFYGGRRYKGPIPYLDESGLPIAAVSPAPVEDPMVSFENARREVDRDPQAWLANQLRDDVRKQNLQTSLEGFAPEFLYLYGRASLLAGNYEEAVRAFKAVNTSPANATLRKEATLGLAAVALKSEKDKPAALAQFDEMMRTSSPSPAPSPVASP